MIGFMGALVFALVWGLISFTVAWTMARGEPWWRSWHRRREAFLAELDRDLS